MTPPRLPRTLLRLAKLGERRAEVEADLAALHARRRGAHGARYATRRYWLDVLSFIRTAWRDEVPAGRRVMTSGFAFDMRQALHAVRRQPAFFAAAAATLAVGFASHFAAFAVVDRLLLATPPHVVRPDTVFRLHIERGDIDGGRFLWFQTPLRSYLDLRDHARGFAGMAAYRSSRLSVGSGTAARMISVTFADEHYFPLLGVSAGLGRVFTAGENRPPSGIPVVVLSHAFWRGAYGEDPHVLGRTMRIGAQTFAIIGVTPEGFNGDVAEPIDAWAPLHTGAAELPQTWTTSLSYRSVSVLTRLRDDTTPALAAGETAAVYRQHVSDTPMADDTARVVLSSLYPGRTQMGQLTQAAKIALCLEAVSLLVLLVAVANVVNLQMSRAAHGRRETAVRVALGAGRGRLLRALTFEMLAIGAAAAAGALVLSAWGGAALREFLLPGAAGAIAPARFTAMALATVLAAVAILVAFAWLPMAGRGVVADLKPGRGGDGFNRARLRQGLLVAQVVLSAILLVGAGLFMRSAGRLNTIDFGIDPEQVLAVTLPMSSAGYAPAAIEAFHARALEELGAVPGVASVAASHTTPFAPSQSAPLAIPGREPLSFGDAGYPTFYTVTPGYFSTMGMRVVRGRGFTDADAQGAPPVIVVEQALARVLWPGEDPIGKCLVVGTNGACREVVGIANDTRRFVGSARGALRYYVPMGQRYLPLPPQALLVRAAGDPRALIDSVREAVLRVDGNLPYVRIRVLRDLAEPEMRPWRLGGVLFAVFGAAALLVASMGVYALLAFIVAQRTREIGLRLALGATPGAALALVVAQSLRWIAIGLVAGLAAALGAARFIEPLLFETSPYDPGVFAASALVLLAVAFAASLVPALRASRVDPNVALRVDG